MRLTRYRPEGFEGQCEACFEWWPIGLEWWNPRHGLRKCRACVTEAKRIAVAESRHRHAAMARLRQRYRNREWMRAYRARPVDRSVDNSLATIGMRGVTSPDNEKRHLGTQAAHVT